MIKKIKIPVTSYGTRVVEVEIPGGKSEEEERKFVSELIEEEDYKQIGEIYYEEENNDGEEWYPHD